MADDKNERGFSWKKAYMRLKKNHGMEGLSPGKNASDELAKSMGWITSKDQNEQDQSQKNRHR